MGYSVLVNDACRILLLGYYGGDAENARPGRNGIDFLCLNRFSEIKLVRGVRCHYDHSSADHLLPHHGDGDQLVFSLALYVDPELL